jgi:adenylylsulfate kinase
VEVYVDAPLEICEARDVKGLYAQARRGEITQFTGIDDAYEPPEHPEVVCRTAAESVEESAAKVLAYLEAIGIAPPRGSLGDRVGLQPDGSPVVRAGFQT